MDILLVAGIAFLLFRLLARRRTATAGGPQPAPVHQEPINQPQAFQSAPGAAVGGSAFGSLPAWFDRERFLAGAKEHFMTLQRAWDSNDFSNIQEYVTPELYNLLREERKQHPANNRTDVVHLFAELGDVREIGNQAEATVIFHGVLDENGEQSEFNETWHLIRDMREGAPGTCRVLSKTRRLEFSLHFLAGPCARLSYRMHLRLPSSLYPFTSAKHHQPGHHSPPRHPRSPRSLP